MNKLKQLAENMMNGKLRDEFENLFEKDEDTSQSKSKSNRSAALVLYGLILAEISRLDNEKD